MHDTAMACGAAFFAAYLGAGPARVLDIGAADVNGSLRSVAPPGTTYVGADLGPDRGVDVVVAPGAPLPFAPESFDAVIATSCFEHDPAFWLTFLHMAEVLRPGGHLYLNMPSNGAYHGYPGDVWRFYPDAGLALAEWARRQGVAMQLVESGTLPRGVDGWNDFVVVCVKAPVAPPRQAYLLDRFPAARNCRRHDREGFTNATALPEDWEIQQRLEAALREAQAENAALRARLAALEQGGSP
ncbi:class I SAM-dependent methyltransferase [Siccirubricoccus sp. KC 17139]|uniref:Class I SAM-dependent methyltransferase n=1 Tax=Siccirubricoccus soli TaxID=2899147 RepID=A0ABT1CZ49_9PROT|nr:class I SAM-dependent methyltransferase [Siccirubricoccus soli]MCO6414921.1 class I SAM-dependent methyltransferase [Siccirubricoccus soli]MCP2681051.1 class I SAM-dependent methyltransferase [Siccirubricoccus soli]